MFYGLNGPPEIDAVLMSSDCRKKKGGGCVCAKCVYSCAGEFVWGCAQVHLCLLQACVCDSNGFKWGIHACKWRHLNLCPPPLKGHPILYLEHHFDISPMEARALWGFGLKWCTIDHKESSRFALYNLSSLEISTTNLQQAPCLMQTLNITHRRARALSITFWRSVQ